MQRSLLRARAWIVRDGRLDHRRARWIFAFWGCVTGCSPSDPTHVSPTNTEDRSATLAETLADAEVSLGSLPPLLRRTASTTTDVDPWVAPGFENAMIETTEKDTSTFALEANTASYALARAALLRGELPDPSMIRTEDVVNRFEYRDGPAPQSDFAVTVETIPSPYREDFDMLRFGIRARDATPFEREPSFLVFVIDVSNSMDKNGHLSLVQDGLRTLAQRLAPDDWVGIVTYGHRAQVALEPTPGGRRAEILAAIDQLRSEGASNLDAGLALAAELLGSAQGPSGRRIVVCSDGVPNAGSVVATQLITRVSDIAQRGVRVSTVGVGLGNYSDALMEQLSLEGRGLHAYVDRREEVRRVFSENLAGAPQIVARYANLQVEFDPRHVARFRRLGYEHSRGSTEAFESEERNEGAIGASHSVAALYEVQLHRSASEPGTGNPLLGTVRIRYHDNEDRNRILEQPFTRYAVQPLTTSAGANTSLALVTAVFAEKLRHSYWARDLPWTDVVALWDALPPAIRKRRDVTELGELITVAATQSAALPAPSARLVFDRLAVLK